jgi:hypothetical protein
MKSILATSEAMQVHLKNLTTLDASRVKYFDQQEEIGFASIVEMDETVALDLNGPSCGLGRKAISLSFGGSNRSMPIVSSWICTGRKSQSSRQKALNGVS